MELFNALESLGNLSASEAVSVGFILVGVIFLTIKSTVRVIEYFKGEIRRSNQTLTVDSEGVPAVCADRDREILIAIKSLADRLTIISSRIGDDAKLESLISYELTVTNDKINELKVNVDNLNAAQREMVMQLTGLTTVLANDVSTSRSLLDSSVAENRTLHKETLEMVNDIAKDIAQLQGTLIGGISSRNGLR